MASMRSPRRMEAAGLSRTRMQDSTYTPWDVVNGVQFGAAGQVTSIEPGGRFKATNLRHIPALTPSPRACRPTKLSVARALALIPSGRHRWEQARPLSQPPANCSALHKNLTKFRIGGDLSV
jgi:hypothetical protein